MLRRARAWASAEISRLLHAEIVDARSELESSVQTRVRALADEVDRDAQQREQSIAVSLDRLANALDAISQQLAEQSRDHRASLAAVEFVVREMALASMQPAPPRAPTVLGGTIDPMTIDLNFDALAAPEVHPRDGMGTRADTSTAPDDVIDLEAPTDPVELHIGCIVEVRSRFQNRWVDGFEIVEIVPCDGVDRYRLARHADHVRLPVLFDMNDLRPLDVVSEIVIETALHNTRTDTNGAPASISVERDDPGSRR